MADPIPWTFATGGTVSETLTWLTDVLPAVTGPEQTRRLREARTTAGACGNDYRSRPARASCAAIGRGDGHVYSACGA